MQLQGWIGQELDLGRPLRGAAGAYLEYGR